MPLVSLRPRDIPHGTALWASVDADVDLQVPGAVAVTAVEEIAELDAVGVILAERQEEKLSTLAPKMLRRVDHHEGPCRETCLTSLSEYEFKYFGFIGLWDS